MSNDKNQGRREEDGVTFKIPHKYLVWAALAMGGGGTVWTRLEQAVLGTQTERADKAMYETLAKSLEDAHGRIDACEGRLHVLENGSPARSGGGADSGGRGARGRGAGFGSGAGRGLSSTSDGDGLLDVIPRANRPHANLPSFEALKQIAEDVQAEAPAAAAAEEPDEEN